MGWVDLSNGAVHLSVSKIIPHHELKSCLRSDIFLNGPKISPNIGKKLIIHTSASTGYAKYIMRQKRVVKCRNLQQYSVIPREHVGKSWDYHAKSRGTPDK